MFQVLEKSGLSASSQWREVNSALDKDDPRVNALSESERLAVFEEVIKHIRSEADFDSALAKHDKRKLERGYREQFRVWML